MANARSVVKVVVDIAYEDGLSRRMEFFHRGEPFNVTVEEHMGSPKAQLGGVTIKLPRWPAAQEFIPAPKK